MKKLYQRLFIFSLMFVTIISFHFGSIRVYASNSKYTITTQSNKSKSSKPLKAPMNSRFTEYVKKIGDSKKGFIPSTFNISKTNTTNKRRLYSTSIPTKYDLRTLNRLTPVGNQYSSGNCWAFAVYGSLESNLVSEGYFDFSENNLINKNGFDWNGGGNNEMATAYLARWEGPVLESDDKFLPQQISSPDNLKVQRHIQDVIYMPGRENSLDNDDIKLAIEKYGALSSSLYWNNYYYDSNNYTYSYKGYNYSNHAIDIVGWDDNFSRDKFKDKPEGDGAFICRNSWGEEWGEKGYFYVSYYDNSLAMDNGAIFENAEPTSNYDNIYQYDPLGCIGNDGYDSETSWYSNVFMSKGNESLSAVSFYTNVNNAQYNIYINKNFSGAESLDKSNLIKIKSGTIDMPGYHTVKLDLQSNSLSDLNLIPNSKFAVAVQVTTPGSTYPIPIEYPYPDYSSNAKANPGESYISPDGVSWQDVNLNSDGSNNGENTNVCLKAFTKNTLGDVDEDGSVAEQDALILKGYLLGNGNVVSLDRADVDRDGKVTSSDYVYIHRYIEKLISNN